MNKEDLNKIEKEARELLSGLEISAEAKISFNEENNCVDIQIDSDEAATLIGFHGETLLAIQVILSFLIHKSLGSWVKVMVNVGDYRQRREEQLKKLAMTLAMKVKFSGEAQTVPNLSPAERRIVHIALTDHPDVCSESEGEGRDRQLVIKPKILH